MVFESAEALGVHLRDEHGMRFYASMACNQWVNGDAACPLCPALTSTRA